MDLRADQPNCEYWNYPLKLNFLAHKSRSRVMESLMTIKFSFTTAKKWHSADKICQSIIDPKTISGISGFMVCPFNLPGWHLFMVRHTNLVWQHLWRQLLVPQILGTHHKFQATLKEVKNIATTKAYKETNFCRSISEKRVIHNKSNALKNSCGLESQHRL